MNENHEALLQTLKTSLENATSLEEVRVLYRAYLGSKGSIKQLYAGLKDMSPEEKREKGPVLAQLLQKAQEMFEERQKNVGSTEHENFLHAHTQSLPLHAVKIGHLHPVSQTIRQLNNFFGRMGYSVTDGPEIETDEFCFQRLNVPADHPARDMQDTLYIEEPNILLRTQTSSIEARILATHKPPFKFVSPGRSYRNEKVNKSNHFVFHQYQGVVVLKETSLKDLFGTFTALFREMYGPDVVIRFRNKYYPEVEPGVGPDMQCFSCHGVGCTVCKNVGWIEMGGAGIIHPDVMRMAGLDPLQWRGFAFGLGLDRFVMAKYNITDIRTLLGGDLAYQPYKHEGTL
ncbi:MAG: phenylalanine--tRNA ligase subunit alpha [bacterium]|nr:phenylalanine--tRNA ligase subunit alpha [bacterium]